MILLIILLMVPHIFTIVNGNIGLDGNSMFINSLKDHATYDKRLRPYHMEDTLNVTISMTISSFGEIDEIEGEFTLDIFFNQYWKDPRLRNNSSAPIILPGEYTNLIWHPDTYFINVKNAKYHDVPTSSSDAKLNQHGEVRYSKRITLTAGCDIDLHRYPLDSQICQLRIMSYAHDKDEIDYRWKGNPNKDITVINDQMAQLIVTDIQRLKTTSQFKETIFSELVALFKFERRFGYSLIQVYAPTFLIVALSWLSFWISKNAVPARIALGVTTVLTIVTLNSSFRSTVPKVSYIKALDLYLIVSFFFVFGAVLEYVTVLLYHDYSIHCEDKNANEAEVEIQEENKSNSNQETEEDNLPKESSANSPNARETSQQSSPNCKTKPSDAVCLIRKLISVNSTPIDKISKIAFPVSYVLFNVIYWVIYTV